MADEAFALSPINARASLPTDGDYDAICNAFMETSRGRWFLSEYAKRNRNADTRLVLDAVERLETTLASQKQPQAEPPPQVDLWPDLMKAFTKARIEIAQRMIADSDDAAFESIRNGVEMIKKVSRALRERGWDVRICDVFDAQVSAITDGYTGLLAAQSIQASVQSDVLAAFDALAERVEALAGGGDPQTHNLDAIVDAVADAMGEDFFTSALADDPLADTPVLDNPLDQDAAFHEIYACDNDIEIVDAAPSDEPLTSPAASAPSEPEINRQRLYEAKAEPYRSAPIMESPMRREHELSPADDVEIVDVADDMAVHTAPIRQNDTIVVVEPVRDPVPTHSTAAEAPADGRNDAPAQAASAAAPSPASLGAALLANGLVRSPDTGRSDPLAPFRRMSQAERIAFFS